MQFQNYAYFCEKNYETLKMNETISNYSSGMVIIHKYGENLLWILDKRNK